MKTVKIILTAILLTAFVGYSNHSFGQGPKARMTKMKEMREKNFEELVKRLSLTEEQQIKIKEIGKKHREAMKADREKIKNAPPEERKKIILGHLKQADSEINALLNDKQKEQYKQFKEEKKAERKKKREEMKKEQEELMDEGLLF